MAKDKEVCLGCSKKFSKSEKSLQCVICGLWIHQVCSGVTDELFDLIEKQLKITGTTYWACRPCTVYSQGMTHRMKEIEEKVGRVEKSVDETKEKVKNLDKKVDGLTEEVKKKDDKVAKAVKEMENKLCEEWREREAKRMNVILHNVGEAEDERATGKERQEWDIKSCYNICNALKIKMGDEAIRFARRVGEKKEGPRPMVVGFWAETDRTLLLRNAKYLDKHPVFKNVTIGPDLTRKQRAEEEDMKKEADRRNERELTEEDVSKNLKWTVAGDRGKKCLVKRVARADHPRMREREGGREREEQRRSVRVPPTMRGKVNRGQYERNRGKTPRGRTESATETDTESETATEAEMETETEAGGRKSKRKVRSPNGGAGHQEEPPRKR